MPLRQLSVRPSRGVASHQVRSRNSSSIARQHQYSVQRLCALQTYTESTSMARVVAVCGATVLVPLALILALDLVPLQPPEAGWSKNGTLWCRMFAMYFAAMSGCVLQLHAMAPAAELTATKIARIGCFTAGGYTASAMLIAKLWVFPIPFMNVLVSPLVILFLFLSIVLTIGARNLRENAELRAQCQRYLRWLILQENLLMVYPLYSVGFTSLSGKSQLAFLFLLPVIKFVIKRLMKHALADLEDLVPAIVVSVDFFNALYQSKCMQSSGSILATVGIIGIDLAQNFVSLYHLFGCVRELEALLDAGSLASGVIPTALDIASHPTLIDTSELLDIRTLELLWRCELVLLVEYVEAAIPMLYAIYLAILYQLPNAKYYPETAHMDAAELRQAIARIATYSALELISLVFVHRMLRWRFKLSPLHQLAFTLESEWLLIQGPFVAWGVTILTFTLAHHGVDFTFHFAWMAAGGTS